MARTSALVTAVYWRFLEEKACAEPSDENSGLPEQTCNVDAIFIVLSPHLNIFQCECHPDNHIGKCLDWADLECAALLFQWLAA